MGSSPNPSDSLLFKREITRIVSLEEFNDLALKIFRYQAKMNPVYEEYLGRIGCQTESIADWKQIPCLPIEFFKTHKILCGSPEVKQTFRSSGTTGSSTSQHLLADPDWYQQIFTGIFHQFYGPVEEWAVLALLPSYLERNDSSLVFMAQSLIQQSQHPSSGFYLNELTKLGETLQELESRGQKTLLIGVSFALLDLVESNAFQLENTIIMETGGMKGRRKEMVRSELHKTLCQGFGVDVIHSEYGMTELLSQAYSKGEGRFECPPWMQVSVREINDPFALVENGKTGGLNVIDLANVDSCCFIATQDLGRVGDGDFEVLGRFDNSDIRGCNLMIG